MQKKIIALAVAGLVSGGAFAQANVTVSGNIGVSYDNYSLNAPTTARTTYRQNLISDQSSAIILKGEENLGGGLTAWFQLDNRLSMDRGLGNSQANGTGLFPTTGLGNGNTAIGFKGSWGSVGFGRWDMHYDAFASIGDVVTAGALGARFGYFGVMAQVNGNQIALGTRASNVGFYDSPVWNGLKLRLAASTAAATGEGEAAVGTAATNNGDPGNGSAWQLRLDYNNGPWNAVYSYWNHKVEGRGNYTAGYALATSGAFTNTVTATAAPNPADEASSRVGAAYSFPMGVKVGLGWDRSTRKNNTAGSGDFTRTAWMLPISYTTGNHTMGFTYASAGQTTNTAAAGNGSTTSTAKQYMVHYGYNFSKRTGVGVQYISLNNGAAAGYNVVGSNTAAVGYSVVTAGEDARLLSFNIRHFF